MWYHNMDIYIWILILCMSFVFTNTAKCTRDSRCKVSRIHGMKGADCYNKDMRTFSQCLPSDVEIIDLSRNRIRKLSKQDLEKYSDLKMLYLSDNVLVTIDDGSFSDKDDLHTLDLSINALSKIPSEVFQLPSLHSLYLGHNLNMNIVDVVEKSKPVTSPLYHLDISYVMSEEASELPDLGPMPMMKKYNISGNKLWAMNAKHFAGLCSLEILDTNNVSIEYEEDKCECWTINRWLKSRKVNFKNFECTIDESECGIGGPSEEDLKMFAKCENQVEANLTKSKITMITLIVVPTVLGIIAVVICCLWKAKQRQRQQRPRKEEHSIMLNNVTKANAGR